MQVFLRISFSVILRWLNFNTKFLDFYLDHYVIQFAFEDILFTS